MSWLFSQALVAEYLAGTCSDGEPCVQSNGNPIPQAYCAPDRMTKFCRLSRFGMTFKPLTESRGEDLLTWYREDFLAKTSALPERALDLTEKDQECGITWRESLGRYDRDTHTLKTAQCSLFEDLIESSVTLPRWGSMQAGELFRQPTLVRPIAETESGLLPTPLASNTKAHHLRSGGRPARSYIPTPIATEWKNGCGKTGNRAPEKAAKAGMKLGEYAKLWPTPTSSLGTNGGQVTPTKAREGGTLIEALSARTLWPTPTVCGNYNRKGMSANSGDGLATAVATWPTPTASDNRPRGTPHATARRMRLGKQVGLEAMVKWTTPTAHNSKEAAYPAEYLRVTPTLAAQAGGALNPTWVEWLMGWPLGWTDLKQLGMDKYQQWLRRHGAC